MNEKDSIFQNVFISYSRSDAEYRTRLHIHLKPLVNQGLIDVWSDSSLHSGDDGDKEIKQAIKQSTIAILLMSADYMASNYINEIEVPLILEKAKNPAYKIMPIIVSGCRYTRDNRFKKIQAVNDPKETVARMTYGKQENFFDKVSFEIEEFIKEAKIKSYTEKYPIKKLNQTFSLVDFEDKLMLFDYSDRKYHHIATPKTATDLNFNNLYEKYGHKFDNSNLEIAIKNTGTIIKVNDYNDGGVIITST